MTSALRVYAEVLEQHSAGGSAATIVRFSDGSARPLEVGRWIDAADAVDEHVLAQLRGPVLDVGCGPGRHLHALASRGVFGLGVDLCPAAVQLARGRGANAIVGSIFGEVPYAGTMAERPVARRQHRDRRLPRSVTRPNRVAAGARGRDTRRTRGTGYSQLRDAGPNRNGVGDQ